MYDSPIEKIIGEMRSQMVKNEEGQLMVQVPQEIGYKIDKDELIKALNYDRQQYEKGYEDGLNANRWIPCEERMPENNDRILASMAWGGVVACSYTDKKWIAFGFTRHFETEYVRAWMPLPEPYKVVNEVDV